MLLKARVKILGNIKQKSGKKILIGRKLIKTHKNVKKTSRNDITSNDTH